MTRFDCGWTLAVITSLLIVSSVVSSLVTEHENSNEINFDLAKLLDYDYYKRVFGKSYSSEVEDSTRQCYFNARALVAFVSGVNFKYRHSDYFNALNSMSDWTPEERAQMKNKHQRSGVMTRTKTRLETMQTLRDFLESHSTNPIYADLLNKLDRADLVQAPGRSHRVKRKVGPDGGQEQPRNFSFGRLINAVDDSGDFERGQRVASNNPHYAGIETVTRGLRDQIQEINYTKFELPQPEILQEQLDSSLLSLEYKDNEVDRNRVKLADEVFVDHSNSNCMSPVRHQGKCGACYAFASTAFFEWLYCKKTNRLVEFSEQYMIDCANGRIEGAFGCDGGIDNAVMDFVHNFGLELRSNYPYVGNSGDECPYDDDTDLSTTGYIRMELESSLEIPIEAWHLFIEHTPLYVVVDCDDSFSDYGGGVHAGGLDCIDHAVYDTGDYHAMLIVGHGREDGQEYWLIRNSYGKSWGERGYYKLSKGAQKECIQYQQAYAFGTADGFDFKVRPRKNRKYSRV